MFTDDGGTEYLIFTRYGQHLDKAVVLTIGYCPIKIIQTVDRCLIGGALGYSILFVKPYPCYLRSVKVAKGITE